jgi:GTPase SAR1 family protein
MIGSSGCGKTSLLLRFMEDRFEETQICTIGVDFKIKSLSVDDNPLKL